MMMQYVARSCKAQLLVTEFQSKHFNTQKVIRPNAGHQHATTVRVQELCENRGGRPGLSVLTSLIVSVDVKNY